MLKKKNVDVVLDEDMYEEEKPSKRVRSHEEPKKKKSGFFEEDAFKPYTGKICGIQYFVFSLACLFCPMFFLFGGSKGKLARDYMAECGDTDGVGFLAAGNAIRAVAVVEWILVLFIIVLSLTASSSLLLGGMMY